MKLKPAVLALFWGASWGQAIPDAPPVPVCSWSAAGPHSTCKFKDAMSGTPTSVAGKRVIVYRFSKNGGFGPSCTYLDNAVERLAARYGFIATITEDPAVFEAGNLSDAKVVILNNGDGDAIPPGPNRTALEDFQQAHGWGVIWIHAACEFITSNWPFGRQSCVQQYFHQSSPGTSRRMFIDSGTADNPNQGIRNPQSEFLLRDLPGWGGKRALQLKDQWFCFQAPARETAGVNVLFGYDHSSGLPASDCPDSRDSSEAASQRHNMVWTHLMGNGITLYNSWGLDEDVPTLR